MVDAQGFLTLAPNQFGQNHFVTRDGEAAAQLYDVEAWRKANLFPDYFDAALIRYDKALFSGGDYDTAVFRASKEVETRVRKKSGFKSDYGAYPAHARMHMEERAICRIRVQRSVEVR
jgi:hypothetical protein